MSETTEGTEGLQESNGFKYNVSQGQFSELEAEFLGQAGRLVTKASLARFVQRGEVGYQYTITLNGPGDFSWTMEAIGSEDVQTILAEGKSGATETEDN